LLKEIVSEKTEVLTLEHVVGALDITAALLMLAMLTSAKALTARVLPPV